jgi:phosphoglycerate dehydrogenase-like enzyme
MKVLFCGDVFPEARKRLLPLLSEAGHELIECPGEGITRYLDDVDVVIPAIARIDSYVLERGRFGLVQQFGVGLETVDIEAATRFGVWVARVPSSKSGMAASVAEHALFLMLALSRRLEDMHQSLENHRVGGHLGVALLGKTACIVGMGNIGTALALRLRSCGMRLLAVENHPERVLPEAGICRVFTLSELRQAVAEADYILVCTGAKKGTEVYRAVTKLQETLEGKSLIKYE